MRSLSALLSLVWARARRRPGCWLVTAFGIALAIAFAGGVIAEGTIAADRSARAALASLSPTDRAVRITWQGIITPSVERRATTLLRDLGLNSRTEVVLLNPVRLGGVVVRPAAIEPLSPWITASGAAPAAGPVTRCLPTDCPVLIAGGSVPHTSLAAAGVRLRVIGAARLRSALPLGFVPASAGEQQPLLLSGDASGLESLPALSAVYRTHSWVSELSAAQLHSWQLASTEARLQRTQSALLAGASEFSLTAPFAGLDAARAQADAAPRRLLLAGGGALAALLLFVVLTAGGLRRDQSEELDRLRRAGARTTQCVAFVSTEAALLCGAGALVGAIVAIAAGAVLASAAGLPVGAVLTHSLLTPAALGVLVGAWLCATALVALSLLQGGRRIADVAAIAAVAALALALLVNRDASGNDPLPVLLAPLCCIAAGVLVFRAAAWLLELGERLGRRGPVPVRLAFVGLARSPTAPALAIAFIAVSTGLGGFALAYRATLLRGTADQAANLVPLDAIVAPGPDFATPLEVASATRWRELAAGAVEPVRRTDASFVSGGATVTVPALGVPAAAIPELHGWRSSDANASLKALAARLTTPGPVRTSGPQLPPTATVLSVQASAPAVGVEVIADLRDHAGSVRQISLGSAGARPTALRATIPPGNWELEALELNEPTGLELTNGHQNGENAAAATQLTTTVQIGPVRFLNSAGHTLATASLGSWRAVGAASGAHPRGDQLLAGFATSGSLGVLRPAQPSDQHPLAVLVDSQTAAAAGRGHRLALTVDGVPVEAKVVGVLARFPTVPADAAGFVVADERTLAAALDAQAPGQGRPDELWLTLGPGNRLRAVSHSGPLAQFSYSLRRDLQRQLEDAPIARGVLGTLLVAAAICAALAVLGLLVSLLGGVRDARVEDDLVAQGMGPRALRHELRLRLLLAAALGVTVGLAIAALLTRLAVASVRAAGSVATPTPALVTVAPWVELAAWGLAALAALVFAAWVATRAVVARSAPA